MDLLQELDRIGDVPGSERFAIRSLSYDFQHLVADIFFQLKLIRKKVTIAGGGVHKSKA